MKWVVYLSVLIIGCSSAPEEQIQVTKSTLNEPVVVKSRMDSMLDVISYVDSAQVVEKQVETVTKLKEENEKLEEAIIVADKTIREISTELKETREVVRSITSDTNVTPFILLPIQ